MRDQLKKVFPYVMFAAAWALILAAFLLGKRAPKPAVLALYTLGGMLMGFGAVGTIPEPAHRSPRSKINRLSLSSSHRCRS